MTLRTKTIASACTTLALAVAWTSAQPAMARWTFHNDSLGETITAPAGGTRAQTCTNRLAAVSGWARFIDVENGEDPAALRIPAEAKTAVDYEVWKAPPGFPNFNLAIEDEGGGVYFEDPDGTRHEASVVGRTTTPPRKSLRTPIPANGNPKVRDNFVFTSAPMSVRLRGVKPGDALGLRPAREPGGIYVNVTAMDCRLPVLKAKVDVRPGSKANKVYPNKAQKLIPVRIFGSARLNVKRIKEIHLGEAAPASVPQKLKPKLKPRDVNRDGRLDRLYYFRQGDTYIMCIDTKVNVTGRTSDKKRFQARSAIAAAGCDG
jgi:hypothetical protein